MIPLPIFIVVVNYNGGKALLDCLGSVYASTYKSFEVVVVDNASYDSSLERAKERFSRAHFIVSGKNLGFAGGVNVGIRYALEKGAGAVFLLNNDAVVDRDTIGVLVKENLIHGGGIYSPKIYTPKGLVWFEGGKIRWFRKRAEHVPDNREKTHPCSYVPGCAMFISREVFEKTSLFDEAYFLYYEDVDFCLRAKKSGYESWVVPETFIVHEEASEKQKARKTYYLIRSAEYFFKQHAPWWIRLWYILFGWVRNRKSARRLKHNPKDAVGRAVYRALRSLPYENQ